MMILRPTRKSIVFGAALVSACATGAGPAVNTSTMSFAVTDQRELLPDEQVQHVLNRLAFGARPGDAAAVRAMGIDKWIALQLNPDKIDDARLTTLVARYPALTSQRADLVDDFREARQARQQGAAAQAQQRPPMDVQRSVPELQASLLTRAVASERQLNEVMVNFWENHFSVFAQKGQQERLFLIEYDRDVIRPNAMGKFRDLLGAVAHSPAMLFYLDNWQSQADSIHPTLAEMRTKGRPRLRAALKARPRRGVNENYARELMELHTLGVDGGYTQQDVQEVARALTGWTINLAQGGGFVFNPAAHDAGEKTILGKKFAAGRGIEEGEEVLDLVARHPSTARFITSKLARYFISDDPPKSVVDRCSAVFTKTDGDIRSTLGCVITGPEFFSRAAYRAKVKTPFQVVASAMRAMDAMPDQTPRSVQTVAQLGQPIFGHQTPEGWPDRAEAWMNSGAILNRINFGLQMSSGRVPGVTFGRVAALDSLHGAARDAQVEGVVKWLFGGQVSPDTREVLRSGENPLATEKNQLGGLQQIVGLALGAPEFQRR
jgi:uncharacterized protein (DUF1800 family)